MKYITVWCFLCGVASMVVGAKSTEESYFKNLVVNVQFRGLLNMVEDSKLAQR